MENVRFEDALKKLGDIVDQLESGELELEESIDVFEEGIKLSLYCQQELKKAEGRIRQLVKNLNGEFELQDFEL
ncbi:MAG: exodeoxyribonuclease VII small subunit [Syntrophomonadaceae bacterium]|nr:exodeoxyribonuclease VII small subunit [Syntrophomonadaceae bacterium]